MANNLLPQEILPQNVPFVNKDGKIDKNWWLFLYNLQQQIIGPTASDDEQILTSFADSDSGSDSSKNAAQIGELQTLFGESEVPAPTVAQFDDLNLLALYFPDV